MIPHTSKLTSVSISHRSKLLCLFRQGDPTLSAVMTSERTCERLTFLLSVLAHIEAILIVSAHQSAHKAPLCGPARELECIMGTGQHEIQQLLQNG